VIRAALERLSPFAADLGIALDEATRERLASYLELLETWNRKIRLTGDRDLETLAAKHCADSLAAAAEVSPSEVAMDVGSGAGFPGLVIACVRPTVRVTLVESREKASSFLDAAAARIGLGNVTVVNARVEDLASRREEAGSYGVVMSRGVRMAPILPAVHTLLTASGTLLLMLAGGQDAPEKSLVDAGFRPEGERSYTLPSGERRRIARYGRA
jgi:16S rRNA (guanine527-N7)-methyltransferase